MSKLKKIYGVLVCGFIAFAGMGTLETASAEIKTVTIKLNGGFTVENSVCATENFTVAMTGDSIRLTCENVLDLFQNGNGARYVYGLAKEEFRGKTPKLTFHNTGIVSITGESVAVNADGTYFPAVNKVIPGGVLFGFFDDGNRNGLPDESETLYRIGDVMPVSDGATLSCYYETNMYFRPTSDVDVHSQFELVDGFIEKPTSDVELLSVQDLQPLQGELVKIGNAAFNEPGKKINYIELPDTVTEIGDRVFRNTNAKKVYGLEHINSFGDTTMYNTAPPTEPLVLSANISGIYRDSLYWNNAKDVVAIVFTGDVAAQGYDGETYTFLCRDGLSRTNPCGNMKQYIYVPYGQTKNYYPTYETYLATMRKAGHAHSGNANAQSEWRFNTDASRDYLKMREYHEIVFDLNGGNADGNAEIPVTRMDARAVSVLGRTFDSETKTELNLRGVDEVLRNDRDTRAATYTLPNEAAQDLSILKARKPTDPVKQGKVFVGWEDETGTLWTDEDWARGGRSDDSYKAVVKLTAKWAEPVTVKIVSNTKQEYGDLECYAGAKLNEKMLPNPNPINYKVFDGWYKTPDFSGEKWSFVDDEIRGDMTLYAKWKSAVYNAKLYVDGGSVEGKSSEFFVFIPFVYGEGAEIPVPVKNGYTFAGWYEDSSFSGEPITRYSLTSSCPVYYAKWDKTNVVKKIDYVLDGGENSRDNPTDYLVGETVYLSDASKHGYRFEGWYPDRDFVYEKRILQISADCDSDMVLYAKFTALKKYTVRYADGGQNDNPETFYEGERLLLSNPTKQGYTFSGWYRYSDFYGESVVALFGDLPETEIVLYAKWQIAATSKINYVLDGAALPENSLYRYNHGEIYYLPVPIKADCTFVGWYTDSDFVKGTEITHIGMDRTEDVTIYARFEKTKLNPGDAKSSKEKNYGVWVGIGIIAVISVSAIGSILMICFGKKHLETEEAAEDETND